MNIAILGNSHVAAWKLAADEAERANVDVTFFAATSNNLLRVKAEGDEIRASDGDLLQQVRRTSGAAAIKPDDHDLIVIIGLTKVPDLEARFSSGVIDMLVGGIREYSGAAQLLRKIGPMTAKAVVVIPEPLPADPTPKYPPNFKPMSYKERLAVLQRAFPDATVLGQPEHTLQDQLRTKSGFSSRAPRLDPDADLQPASDYTHMNAEFGRACWRSLFDLVLSGGVAADDVHVDRSAAG